MPILAGDFLYKNGGGKMKMFRQWRVRYGVLRTGAASTLKSFYRRFGLWMKTHGRKLEHMGDEVTPKWGHKLFERCYLAEAEIHYPGEVFRGDIDSIFQKFNGKESFLVVNLKKVTYQKGFSVQLRKSGIVSFEIHGYGDPVVIDDLVYDCVWTSFKNGGHIVIYFSIPITHSCFN